MADFNSNESAVDILGTLARALLHGLSTGGNDVEITNGDVIRGVDSTTGQNLVLRGGNSSTIAVGGADLQLSGGTPGSGANPGVIQMLNGGGDDTKPVFSITSQGSNGATVHYFVGTRDPGVASISAIAVGDVYVRSDGRLYSNTSEGWIIQSSGWSQTRNESGNYLAKLSDTTIFVNASGGERTITLPTAVGNNGKQYKITKKDSSTNFVIIAPDGSETINGSTDLTLIQQYSAVILESDDTEWGIF